MYNGESKANPKIVEMVKKGQAIPVCPEQLGGLTTPREQATSIQEIINKAKENTEQVKSLITRIIPDIPEERNCFCATALKDAFV
jgi:uncharacterized protein YbbK (DUF523 family)